MSLTQEAHFGPRRFRSAQTQCQAENPEKCTRIQKLETQEWHAREHAIQLLFNRRVQQTAARPREDIFEKDARRSPQPLHQPAALRLFKQLVPM